MKKIYLILIIILAIAATGAAQEKESGFTDVIIRVDGELIYGIVTEINSAEVKYRDNSIPSQPLISIPRDQVYMISYSNNTSVVITPKFGKGQSQAGRADSERTEETDSVKKITQKMKHGSVKIGMGFSEEFSRIKGVEDFDGAQNLPSLYASYEFSFYDFLITGIGLGYASSEYTYVKSSDYDQVDIEQQVDESIFTLGVYGKYELMEGFFRPYIQAGLNFNYTVADSKGYIFFREESKAVANNTTINGFKVSLLARAGVDLHISKSFGLYSDIGTGNSLIQVGAKFILK